MMNSFMNVARVALAIIIVSALFMSIFFVFLTLLGIALVAAVVMWLRRSNIVNARSQWGRNNKGRESVAQDSYENITVIEGEVHEVDARSKDDVKQDT